MHGYYGSLAAPFCQASQCHCICIHMFSLFHAIIGAPAAALLRYVLFGCVIQKVAGVVSVLSSADDAWVPRPRLPVIRLPVSMPSCIPQCSTQSGVLEHRYIGYIHYRWADGGWTVTIPLIFAE